MKRFSLLATIVITAVAGNAQIFTSDQQHSSSVVGIASGQTAKLNVLYPSVPAPLLQVMCRVTLNIVDDQGIVLKSQDFQMSGGHSVSLSLNADTDLSGRSAQIHAVTLTPVPSSGATGYCAVLPSLDIVDNASGKTLVHLETTITFPRPIVNLPGLPAR